MHAHVCKQYIKICAYRDTIRYWIFLISVGLHSFLAAILKATNTQVNKAGGSIQAWCLKAVQESIFPVASTELMNFH